MSFSVLVIDDQPLEGEMISLVLKRNRPDVHFIGQALNATKGIQMTALHQPNLIFLDIKMPGMDGLDAITPLCQACPHTRIIMLTAFDDFEYLRTALRAGARDYLLKPVRPTDILSALDRLSDPARALSTPVPGPSQSMLATQLAETIQKGDAAQAERAARDYLAYFGTLDSSNTIYACVRCMELAAKLAQSADSGQSGDGLRFFYQEFVHHASALKDPNMLKDYFVNFACQAADFFGHNAGDIGYRQVAKAKRYIADHYHEPLQMSEVAKKLYLSTAYFSRLFKEKTGVTFSDYLADCRVERARQLLATTDMSIAEVAASIGYQEANSFSRLFKARTGQSPSDYRIAPHHE